MLLPTRRPSCVSLTLAFALASPLAAAAPSTGAPVEKFQQLEQPLPSPTAQRNAAGAPGPAYWQNRADYSIAASLDEKTHRLAGRGTITYRNASPDPLTYLWLQLEPNFFSHNADSRTLVRPPPDLTKFPYPYPVAISVNGPVGGGMEYPMICFNRPRPEDDGTYAKRTKYGLIGVVSHEVGHNYFPMSVNSDERQWTWMDEGLTSFVQLLAQEEWAEDWPQRRDAREIKDYMRQRDRVPVMSNSESIHELGFNSYAQPTVALNLRRDVVLGRALFDHAFKTYALILSHRFFQRRRPRDAVAAAPRIHRRHDRGAAARRRTLALQYGKMLEAADDDQGAQGRDARPTRRAGRLRSREQFLAAPPREDQVSVVQG